MRERPLEAHMIAPQQGSGFSVKGISAPFDFCLRALRHRQAVGEQGKLCQFLEALQELRLARKNGADLFRIVIRAFHYQVSFSREKNMQAIGRSELLLVKLAFHKRNKCLLQDIKMFFKFWDKLRAFKEEIFYSSRCDVIQRRGGKSVQVCGARGRRQRCCSFSQMDHLCQVIPVFDVHNILQGIWRIVVLRQRGL